MFNFKLFKRKNLYPPPKKWENKKREKKSFGYDPYTEIGSRYRSFARSRIGQLTIFLHFRAQASKALGVCESKNEFEGSYERVEFERLLIEAHHKHKYASDEINRLKNMMARGQLDAFKGKQDVKKKHICFHFLSAQRLRLCDFTIFLVFFF